jgi:hypothetical protein
MNTGPGAAMEEMKARLSTLWIVMFALLTADVLSSYIPAAGEEMAGFAGETPIPLLMLVAAILNAIPILMIYLARVLKPRANRWANIIAAVITIVYLDSVLRCQPQVASHAAGNLRVLRAPKNRNRG